MNRAFGKASSRFACRTTTELSGDAVRECRGGGTMVGRPVLWPLVWKIHALQVHREPAPQDPEGARYRVTNWPEYDDALVRRGSLTVWFTGKAVSAWHAPATGERGGQPVYSALAIGTGLALRLVFQQPFIAAPDHTTLSPPWQAHHHAMSRPDCQSCDERYRAKGWRHRATYSLSAPWPGCSVREAKIRNRAGGE